MTDETPKSDRAALYEQTCAAMLYVLVETQKNVPTFDPKFALPPVGIPVFACLDEVPTIARNEDARLLAEHFCKVGCTIGGPGAEPSLLMLEYVLDAAKLPFERVSLEELDLHPPWVPTP